jgi:hypothetical protein
MTPYAEEFFICVISELCAQLLESQEMGIEPPPSNFISPRFGYVALAETGEQGA